MSTLQAGAQLAKSTSNIVKNDAENVPWSDLAPSFSNNGEHWPSTPTHRLLAGDLDWCLGLSESLPLAWKLQPSCRSTLQGHSANDL